MCIYRLQPPLTSVYSVLFRYNIIGKYSVISSRLKSRSLNIVSGQVLVLRNPNMTLMGGLLYICTCRYIYVWLYVWVGQVGVSWRPVRIGVLTRTEGGFILFFTPSGMTGLVPSSCCMCTWGIHLPSFQMKGFKGDIIYHSLYQLLCQFLDMLMTKIVCRIQENSIY